MRDTARRHAEAVAVALRHRGPSVEKLAEDRWRLVLENGRPFAVDLWLDMDWLLATAALVGIGPARYWEIVRLNGRALPPARFALSPPDGTPRLRAELPLPSDRDEAETVCARQMQELCASFELAMGLLDGKPHGAAPAETTVEGDGAFDLAALCRESGWEGEPRPGGRVAVELEGRAGAPALLAPVGEGGVRASVDLGRCTPPAGARRVAAAGLLLTATGHVRMARAVVGAVEGIDRARLEVAFTSRPRPDELHHALRALEIVRELADTELRALQDARVAACYASGQGWSEPQDGGPSEGGRQWEHR